jgi:hypothetical protein
LFSRQNQAREGFPSKIIEVDIRVGTSAEHIGDELLASSHGPRLPSATASAELPTDQRSLVRAVKIALAIPLLDAMTQGRTRKETL